jgi:hypothetical protein
LRFFYIILTKNAIKIKTQKNSSSCLFLFAWSNYEWVGGEDVIFGTNEEEGCKNGEWQ